MAFKIKGWHVLVLILGFALLSGWITVPYWNPPTTTTPPGTQPPTGTITHPAAQIQLQVADFIQNTGVTTATTTVDFCQASGGIFDLLKQADTMTHATNPDTYNVFYPDGTELIIHADCSGNPTNGLAYYDGWFYVVLHEGNQVYRLTPSMLQVQGSSPSYTYKVSTAGAQASGSVVTWTSGTTNFWDLGKIYIMPRTTAAGLNLAITYGATTLSSVTDGSTWVTGSSTANATLAGNTEHLNFVVDFDSANLGWGWKLYGISTSGMFNEYTPILAFSTNMTAIDTAQLNAEGWKPINDNTLYAEKAFYKPLTAMYTTKGSICDPAAIQVPVYDAAASAGKYIFKFWIIDFQLESSFAIGSSSTTVPTAYGMITAFGPAAMIQARAYTTSSGAGSNQAITCWAIS